MHHIDGGFLAVPSVCFSKCSIQRFARIFVNKADMPHDTNFIPGGTSSSFGRNMQVNKFCFEFRIIHFVNESTYEG